MLNFRLSLSDLLVHFERPRPSTAKTYLLIMTKKRHTFEVFGCQFLRLKHRGFGLPLFRGNKYSRPCLGELITNTSSIGHVTWKAAATSQHSYIFVKSTRSNKAFKTLFLSNLSLCQPLKSWTPRADQPLIIPSICPSVQYGRLSEISPHHRVRSFCSTIYAPS